MKLLYTITFLTIVITSYSQKITVKEVNENRTTSDDSFGNKCQISLKLNGDEARKYKFVKISKLTKATDDQGIDLINEDQQDFDYVEIDKNSNLTFNLKIASRKAQVIKQITGEVFLFNPTEANGGVVKIADYTKKINQNLLPTNSQVQVMCLTKESYTKFVNDNKNKKEEELKKLPELARNMATTLISAFEGMFDFNDDDDPNQLFFYIAGDQERLVDVYFEDNTGTRIDTNGKTTMNNLISLSFNEKPNPTWKLILNLETNNSIKKVSFTLVDVDLP